MGNPSVVFDTYTPREERLVEHPEIIEVQFIDKNNNILSQSSIEGIEEGNQTNK